MIFVELFMFSVVLNLTFVREGVRNGHWRRAEGGSGVVYGRTVHRGGGNVSRGCDCGRGVSRGGGDVSRCGGDVSRCGGHVSRVGGGIYSCFWSRCGGHDFGAFADLSHETVHVVSGVRHGPNGAIGLGQTVLSLDNAVGQALLGRLVVAGRRVADTIFIRIRRVRVNRLVNGGGRGVHHCGGCGVHHCCGWVSGGRIILGLSDGYGDAHEANGYL